MPYKGFCANDGTWNFLLDVLEDRIGASR